ncbi:hypothetical protein Hanom_Chr03g00235331 [Helianthus anomalus]
MILYHITFWVCSYIQFRFSNLHLPVITTAILIAHTCHPPAFTTDNHLAPNTRQATNISTVYLLRQTWKSTTERDNLPLKKKKTERDREKEGQRWLLFPPSPPTGNGIC